MTNNDLVRIYKVLSRLMAEGRKFTLNVNFQYFVARNFKNLQPEIETINALLAHSPRFAEYEKKRIAKNVEYAETDDNGTAITREGRYVIKPDKVSILDQEVKAIQEEYKEELELREKQIQAYNEFLEKDNDIALMTVKKSDLPGGILALDIIDIIELIEED